jgi:NitT/TauT family transport system substrate-binding protein
MNEINKLIWPAPNGVGVIDQSAWDRTAEIAENTPNLEGATVLTEAPDEGAWTNDIVEEALANLEEMGIDTTGESFSPIEVTLEEGGT